MNAANGLSVEALLQAIDEYASKTLWTLPKSVLTRAAELTQVTAQSVKRASPAKDGGEQDMAVPFAYFNRETGTLRFASLQAMADAANYGPKDNPEFPVYTIQPLASQMRPQSAVQGCPYLKCDQTEILKCSRILGHSGTCDFHFYSGYPESLNLSPTKTWLDLAEEFNQRFLNEFCTNPLNSASKLTKDEKTLICGNIRSFAAWLHNNAAAPQPPQGEG